VRAVLPAFAIDGACVDVRAHARGHIHDTFVSTWSVPAGMQRFLHQRLNDRVFRDIPALMHNVEVVTAHLAAGAKRPDWHTLALVPGRSGQPYVVAESGPWRTYHFIEGAESFDRCGGPDQAHEAARAFGQFQAGLADLDPARLRETIPRFFSSPFRLHELAAALAADPVGRAAGARAEVAFAQARQAMVPVIDDLVRAGRIPARIVHGDTKLNNVLFDRAGKAVCIVDLDTCMRAYSLYDFGDLVRFTAATSGEDETDPARIGTDLELYAALVEGYRSAATFLSPAEVELMPFAARLVTFTIGLRFLTDFLLGDVYFKTERPGQNLDRARVQFGMVADMERKADSMRVA
jgi:Ser/Thr protein kinase RdoA (MazF antagonist)